MFYLPILNEHLHMQLSKLKKAVNLPSCWPICLQYATTVMVYTQLLVLELVTISHA